MTPTTEIAVVAPISNAVHWKETKNKRCTLFIHRHISIRSNKCAFKTISHGERFLEAREDNQCEDIELGQLCHSSRPERSVAHFGFTMLASVLSTTNCSILALISLLSGAGVCNVDQRQIH